MLIVPGTFSAFRPGEKNILLTTIYSGLIIILLQFATSVNGARRKNKYISALSAIISNRFLVQLTPYL